MPQKLKITTATDPPGHPDLWRIEAENWCLEPVNTKTASKIRRVELDSELRTMGALTIRVKDLGEMETVLFELERGTSALEPDFRERFLLALQAGPDRAAHLARLALGEVGS